ncbi:MAG TPA: amidohydrolase family protein [Phycisphaerae bacterium]|nr:amidohydrolase family protein [Phycisphaerae bacterium]
MIIDVHCHIGFSARRVDAAVPRFSFEANGAPGNPGFDCYFSPRLIARPVWYFVRRALGVDTGMPAGEALDVEIGKLFERHWSAMPSVDRLVLLAFDEYYDDGGRCIGPVGVAGEQASVTGVQAQQVGNLPYPSPVGNRRHTGGSRFHSDMYASNTFVADFCRKNPGRYLFGASIHPYRDFEGRTAGELLEEIARSEPRPVLVKWLPIHQNIRAEDPRTVAFLRKAAELKIAMLIHYGGEMSLARQHMEFEHPGPMIEVLRRLREDGVMPTVIVAHLATPSFRWQSWHGFKTLERALLGEFRDAPLYADISALAAMGRTSWLPYLAKRPALQEKVVWGTDFPIPVMIWAYWRHLDRRTRRRLAGIPSWVERDYQLKKAFGLSDGVFNQAAEILRVV